MNDDAELQAESAQIEQLLEELRALVAAPAYQRIEDVLRRVVRLYGEGLARALDHARASRADDTFEARLCDDDLVASLLVLHGLHPRTTEQRIRDALARLRAELGISLELSSLDAGVAHLAATEPIDIGAGEATVRRLLETVAPELTSIEIAGLPPRRDPSLVQLRTSRTAR